MLMTHDLALSWNVGLFGDGVGRRKPFYTTVRHNGISGWRAMHLATNFRKSAQHGAVEELILPHDEGRRVLAVIRRPKPFSLDPGSLGRPMMSGRCERVGEAMNPGPYHREAELQHAEIDQNITRSELAGQRHRPHESLGGGLEPPLQEDRFGDQPSILRLFAGQGDGAWDEYIRRVTCPEPQSTAASGIVHGPLGPTVATRSSPPPRPPSPPPATPPQDQQKTSQPCLFSHPNHARTPHSRPHHPGRR